MQAIIIEDEKAVQDQLRNILAEVEPTLAVKATISSIAEGLKYFAGNPEADIIFSDIQLTDGLSFEIFHKFKLKIPVVFITGFDTFLMNAFEHNGIDYLLKPVDSKDVSKALLKYRSLERHFLNNNDALEKLSDSIINRKKTRIVVHKGIENISLRLDEVVLFYTESKIVYVLDKCGKKYLCDKNLTDLETELDKNMFFRANRQYIINIEYIKSYKSYERVKLLIDLSIDNLNHSIIISQETAPFFRKWITEN
jgi:DNA-binding LytR/AlgR family response regulator